MSATQGRGLASLRTAGTARREAADRQALLRTPLSQDGPPTAVFDFDKTLTVRDTFLPWLTLLRGRRRTLAAGLGALRAGLSGVSRGGSSREATKAGMARRLLAGIPVSDAQAAARRLVPHLTWSDPVCRRLGEHLAAGHAVLVATGSFRLPVAEMVAARFGPNAPIQVIGTDLDEDAGHLTGQLASANCIGEAKAARVREWLAQSGRPGGWGYGNTPWDLPMLALMQHGVVV